MSFSLCYIVSLSMSSTIDTIKLIDDEIRWEIVIQFCSTRHFLNRIVTCDYGYGAHSWLKSLKAVVTSLVLLSYFVRTFIYLYLGTNGNQVLLSPIRFDSSLRNRDALWFSIFLFLFLWKIEIIFIAALKAIIITYIGELTAVNVVIVLLLMMMLMIMVVLFE